MHGNNLNISKKGWPLLAAFFCLFLGLGAAGWKLTLEKATGHAQMNEVLENTVELISGHDVVVVDHKYDEHWMLKAGKWGVKAVLAAALLQSGLMIFRRQFRQWRMRKVQGHQVFVGLADHNADLALGAVAQGHRVAVIAEDEHHPRLGELEQAGGVVFTGSASDPLKLKAAGVARAARVIVAASGGDDPTIAAAEVAASLGGGEQTGAGRELLVCLQSRQTRELLNQRWSLIVQPRACRTRIVSFEAAALRQMVVRMARELSKSAEVVRRGPRILVAADRTFAEEFLRVATPFIQISAEALPSYWVIADDAGEKAAFELLHPAAGLVAQVHFVETDDRLVAACPDLAGLEFDVAVVKLAGEAVTLQLAERLLRSPHFQVGWVEAVVPDAVGTQLVEDARLKVASVFEMGLRSPEFGDLSLEGKARKNHEAYVAGLKPEERAGAQGWDALQENFRDSNRWAVLHRDIKRDIWQRTADSKRDAMIEHLSICEHQRWMGEKAMDGWRHAALAAQDKRRRLHPSLVTWPKLSEEEKEKDRVQVRKGLN